MADDVTIGSGAAAPADVLVAADEVGGKKIQRVKIQHGADGSATDVSTASPLPVDDNASQTILTAIAASVAGATPAGTNNIGDVDVLSSALPTGAATSAKQDADAVLVGAVNETAPASDTASSGLNGRLQRIAQRLTTLLAGGLPAALGANGGLKVEGVASGTPIPVSGAMTASGTFPVDSSKVEDVAHASGDTGAFVLAVRNDAGTALAGTTGDYIPLSTDANGNLRVAGGGGGTQFAEDAAHTTGDLGTMALGVRKDTATALAGTDGDYIPLIVDASGRLHVNVGALPALPAGTNNIGDVDVLSLPPIPAGNNNIGDVDVASLPALAAGTNAIGKLSANSGVDIGDVDVTSLPALPAGNNNIGDVDVASLPALPAGNNNIGDVDIASALPAGGNAIGSVATELATGLTTFSNTALSNTKTAVKASPGKVYGWMVHNPSAATAYIQVWNVAIGSITVGTTAPTWTIPLPAGASANVMSERGITHGTEINVAATTTPTGSTAPATAAVVAIFYI